MMTSWVTLTYRCPLQMQFSHILTSASAHYKLLQTPSFPALYLTRLWIFIKKTNKTEDKKIQISKISKTYLNVCLWSLVNNMEIFAMITKFLHLNLALFLYEIKWNITAKIFKKHELDSTWSSWLCFTFLQEENWKSLLW